MLVSENGRNGPVRRVVLASFCAMVMVAASLGYRPNTNMLSRRLRSKRKDNTMTQKLQELKRITTRFYIYDDPIISQSSIIEQYRSKGDAALTQSANLDHIKADSDGEKVILEALKNHPLRTFNPSDAELFVVPTPISALLGYGCQWENCTWYDQAFEALQKKPTFQQGHKHIIIALSWPSFNKRFSAFVPALSRNYRFLENVTVAHNYDPFGCLELEKKGPSDFHKVYHGEPPVTKAFSLGLGFNDPFPIEKPTFNKFQTSDYFLFYHSRVKSFAYGSTKYRNAPLDPKFVKNLPVSSIGYDVPYDEWVNGMTSSKFCLVVRGDTPHSHSLLYAVRAGCVPVVVSDDYPSYAPPFKSSLAIEDFAIFIKEEDFIEDPTRELLKLQDLPKELIRAKIDNLYIAQTVVIPNHPNSLFVQAFLKESIESQKKSLPHRPPVHMNEANAILSGFKFSYRYPSTLSNPSTTNRDESPDVIVGVLSESHRFNARHAIRGTWAAARPGKVFFIVAGPWKDIEEEFHQYGDLLWINIEEEGSLSTFKVQLLLHAVNRHVDAYDYVIKTNDDSYILLEDIEQHLGASKPDYWGNCHASQHADGMGYALSFEFNKCASGYVKSGGTMNAKEDIATGELAELCGVSCQKEGWDYWMDSSGKKLSFIKREMKNTGAMLYMHWYVLWERGGWDA
jgi:hypothetical protein